ncbi:MAG: (2Fe-2S)-binding protein [Clostridiales bacterium]
MAEANKEILICRCQEVTLAMVEEAIAEGAFSVDGVKKRTRAGMGLCQGKSCERLVAKIIAEKTGQDPADVLPATSRPPVRPVKMGTIEGEMNA